MKSIVRLPNKMMLDRRIVSGSGIAFVSPAYLREPRAEPMVIGRVP